VGSEFRQNLQTIELLASVSTRGTGVLMSRVDLAARKLLCKKRALSALFFGYFEKATLYENQVTWVDQERLILGPCRFNYGCAFRVS
jgi:hypothetical protein